MYTPTEKDEKPKKKSREKEREREKGEAIQTISQKQWQIRGILVEWEKEKSIRKELQTINQQIVCDKALRGGKRLLSLNKIEYCSIFLGYSKAVNCKKST